MLAIIYLTFQPSDENVISSMVEEKKIYKTNSPEKPERERRDEIVDPFLRVSIGTEGSFSCSGTICYYDENTAKAYILCCGHCYKSKNERPKVRTYFVNGKRQINEFKGTILALDHKNDLAVISFEPDFIPDWVPIGPKDSPFYYPTKAPVGERVVVTGRDSGLSDGNRNPAAYEAFIRKVNDDWHLESIQSQSRGGRSGGGVMTTNRQWLIGVNHGRGSTQDGIGHGLWAPLYRIYPFLERNGLIWLTEVGNIPNKIPIVDELNHKYPDGYIPRVILDNAYFPLDGSTVSVKGECCDESR